GIMVANRIKDQIEQAKFEVSDLSITISIGITQYNNESTEKFISLADELLYRAKRNGRNRVEWEMQKP
ncbi:MAG: diguanylate cyclase, partial [Syntrophomonadaceae bacterium]|nr:diguanylate cyclase [Syntrophomonadaceae bacterium]